MHTQHHMFVPFVIFNPKNKGGGRGHFLTPPWKKCVSRSGVGVLGWVPTKKTLRGVFIGQNNDFYMG